MRFSGSRRVVSFATATVVCAALVAGATAARTPALSHVLSRSALDTTYGWPLKPFHRQHAIRGGFGDPRFGRAERNFHFGIDIAAREGTPVYAVAPGRVYWSPKHVDVLDKVDFQHSVFSGFFYWHIDPAVLGHSYVRRGQLLGYVLAPWDHVHFAQMIDNRWVNPLRENGGLRPYVDETTPTIASVQVLLAGTATPSIIAGTAAPLIVSAYDVPPRPLPPAPWQRSHIAPALIRWRLGPANASPSSWVTAVDFRLSLPPNPLFTDVYAPGTSGNGPRRPGSYLYYLDDGSATARLAPGAYRLEVEAYSSRGGRAKASTAFTVVASAR